MNWSNASIARTIASVTALIVFVYLLHTCGVLDSELGARWNPHGISVYISAPYSEQEKRSFLLYWVIATLVVGIKGLSDLARFKTKLRKVVLSFLAFGANCHVLLQNVNFVPNGSRKSHYIYRGNIVYQIRQKLTLPEYLAVNECKNEPSIKRSMNMFSSGPIWPEINKTAMRLATLHFAQGVDRRHIARFQVVNGGVYLTTFSDNIDSSLEARYQAVVKAILVVSRECTLSDSEFFLQIHDGFQNSYWPVRTENGDVYAPMFVQDKHREYPAVLIPPRSMGPYGFSKDLNYFADMSQVSSRDNHILWSDKITKAVWRGSPTGGFYDESNWQSFPRSKLVMLSQKRPDLIDARFVSSLEFYQTSAGAKVAMEKAGMIGHGLSHEDQQKYKAVIIVDGNSVADRFPWQLASNSVIFKQNSANIEYWYDELIPWVHYVPFKADVSDLEDKLITVLANDTLMQHIANEGNMFALRRLTPRRMKCYWAQLLDTYARHVEQPVVPLPNSRLFEAS